MHQINMFELLSNVKSICKIAIPLQTKLHLDLQINYIRMYYVFNPGNIIEKWEYLKLKTVTTQKFFLEENIKLLA